MEKRSARYRLLTKEKSFISNNNIDNFHRVLSRWSNNDLPTGLHSTWPLESFEEWLCPGMPRADRMIEIETARSHAVKSIWGEKGGCFLSFCGCFAKIRRNSTDECHCPERRFRRTDRWRFSANSIGSASLLVRPRSALMTFRRKPRESKRMVFE